MYIRYFSDLNLSHRSKFNPKSIKPGPDEVLILAGNIGSPKTRNFGKFFDYVSRNFKKIFYVPGNYEYYHKTDHLSYTQKYLKKKTKKYENVSLLNSSSEIYEGYQFIGCTMWSLDKNHCYKINDIYSIPGMNIPFYHNLKEADVEFLTREISTPLLPDVKGKIVITYYSPSKILIDSRDKFRDHEEVFFTNMDEVIGKNSEKIKGWFFGNNYNPFSKGKRTHNGVDFYCNPGVYDLNEYAEVRRK